LIALDSYIRSDEAMADIGVVRHNVSIDVNRLNRQREFS